MSADTQTPLDCPAPAARSRRCRPQVRHRDPRQRLHRVGLPLAVVQGRGLPRGRRRVVQWPAKLPARWPTSTASPKVHGSAAELAGRPRGRGRRRRRPAAAQPGSSGGSSTTRRNGPGHPRAEAAGDDLSTRPGEVVEACEAAGVVASGQPEHAVRPLGPGAARRCSTAATSASRSWRRSRCGRSRTGCPGPRGGRSLSTFIMSIHHLDTFRYWLGDPDRVLASTRPDPRTEVPARRRDQPLHPRIRRRRPRLGLGRRLGRARREGAGGRHRHPLAGSRGPRAWPSARSAGPAGPSAARARSTTRPSTTPGAWHRPRWPEAWFPDAFAGTMAGLLRALETGTEPDISGRDNLKTIASARPSSSPPPSIGWLPWRK